jgi:dTDP-4-amino-4,6-dideoxygalactose transaminase
MTPLQAGLIRSQLDGVESNAAARLERARVYHQGLSQVEGLRVAPLHTDGSHSYTFYVIQVSDRPALLQHLARHRRDVTPQSFKNCADEPCFSAYDSECPQARETANGLIQLPCYPTYPMDDIRENVRVVRQFFGC